MNADIMTNVKASPSPSLDMPPFLLREELTCLTCLTCMFRKKINNCALANKGARAKTVVLTKGGYVYFSNKVCVH